MTDIYIIRHGNTFDPSDTVLRTGARTDLDLSCSGQDQARLLGQFFAARGLTRPTIISGPLKRARQTAEIIGRALEDSSMIEIDKQLREVDYGCDEGQPESEVRARIGHVAMLAWEQDMTPPDGWHYGASDRTELIEYWTKSFAAVSERPTLFITSSTIARHALLALGKPPEKPRTGSFGHLCREGSDLELKSWDQRPGD